MLKRIVAGTIFFVMVAGVAALSACSHEIDTETKFAPYERTYSINEFEEIEKSSFKKLNDVKYPDGTRQYYEVSAAFVTEMNGFAYELYAKTEKLSEGKNYGASPLSLYFDLTLLYYSTADEQTRSEIADVLRFDDATTAKDVINTYKTDFFANDDGTMQIYNGVFLSNAFEPNEEYLKALQKLYAEAYSLDFMNDGDVDKMLDWVNAKVNEKDFCDKKFLGVTPNTTAYLFSTLYFDNKWAYSYNDGDTASGTFYAKSGEQTANFMRHTYLGDAYDYEEYIAVYDYYRNGMKIKYIVPKAVDGDIFALTADKNIFIDDETRRIKTPQKDDYYYIDEIIVNLKMPKFTAESEYDLSSAIKEMGIVKAFDDAAHPFDFMFENLPKGTSIYLERLKQKNKISFSEDGTTIRTVTMAQMDAKSAAPMVVDTIDVDLDRPFIYIIYDANGLPVFVGDVKGF